MRMGEILNESILSMESVYSHCPLCGLITWHGQVCSGCIQAIENDHTEVKKALDNESI